MIPAQQTADATICSNASSSYGQASLISNAAKQGGKVKAYVDFTDFNKNYEDHVRKTEPKPEPAMGAKDTRDKAKESCVDSVLGRSNSNSSQSTEEWVVLS